MRTILAMIILVGVLVLGAQAFVYACESCGCGQMAKLSQPEAGTTSAIEVGNKICPVSVSPIGDMGPAAKYEYKGKVYSFCCTGCISTFKEDPEKYVKIVEESMTNGEEVK